MENNDPNNNKIFFCLDFAKFAFIFNKHNTVMIFDLTSRPIETTL